MTIYNSFVREFGTFTIVVSVIGDRELGTQTGFLFIIIDHKNGVVAWEDLTNEQIKDFLENLNEFIDKIIPPKIEKEEEKKAVIE